MKKLIEKLWDKYNSELSNEYCGQIEEWIDKEDFEQAIKEACKAQRKACWREYMNTVMYDWKEKDTETTILNAQITEEDYGNL